MKTILVTAYAINPYKGSEDGTGWNFVCQIARFQNVIAVTRENNQKDIDKYIKENPNPSYNNIQFLYFDTPYWMRFWKRKGRGALLYYWLWQKMIVGFIKKQKVEFDIAHNLNFHNDWTPSYLWKLNKPFVWGPIGHHPLIPLQYLRPYKIKHLIKDRLAWLVKTSFWKLSSSLRKTISHANHIIAINNSVPQALPSIREKYTIMPVASEDFGWTPKNETTKFTVLSAGRLVPLKGFDLTIQAFAEFIAQLTVEEKQKCELIIVGSGPEKQLCKKIVKDKGIEEYVTFISWIERMELMTIFKESSVFLFPSHEGAGMVVLEALSFGLPVICLNNCGPGEFINSDCGIAIDIQEYDSTIKELAGALSSLYNNPDLRTSMGMNARHHFLNNFHWDRRGEKLNTIYQSL